jgi:hypothetical protein
LVCWEKNANGRADPGDSGVFERAEANGQATEEAEDGLI